MNQHPERASDYLEHILVALERIERYTAGKSAADFLKDTLIQDGVLRNLEVIGEAAHRILAESSDFVAAHPEIPVAKIYATRNRITHGYDVVDLEIVWNLVQFDVPELKASIADTLGRLREAES